MAELRMTEEIRKKMLGLLPFDNSASIDYTPKQYFADDFPEEFRPVFKQRGFSEGEIKDVRRLLKDIEKADDDELNNYARLSVVGWSNLWDVGSMAEIPYSSNGDGTNKEQFAKLPTTVKGSLLYNAVKISGLIDIDRISLKS